RVRAVVSSASRGLPFPYNVVIPEELSRIKTNEYKTTIYATEVTESTSTHGVSVLDSNVSDGPNIDTRGVLGVTWDVTYQNHLLEGVVSAKFKNGVVAQYGHAHEGFMVGRTTIFNSDGTPRVYLDFGDDRCALPKQLDASAPFPSMYQGHNYII